MIGAGIAMYSLFNGFPDPRLGLLGMTLVALGVQAAFGLFFLSVLGRSAPRHRPHRQPDRELDAVEHP